LQVVIHLQFVYIELRIKVIAANNKRLVAKLQTDFSLGQGEAEAIALALKERARIVGIDDKNGINACKLLGLAFTTAVAACLGAAKRSARSGRCACRARRTRKTWTL
jgi:predicted nucleic acid-binding protein